MLQSHGLTTEEALQLRQQYGPNAIPQEHEHPLLALAHKFWAPVPWMLEIVVLLQISLHKYTEAWIIGFLIVFNAAISLFQEGKAKRILRLLRDHLEVQARVLRDGQWHLLPAQDLVPGDIIRLRMGDIVPADALLLEGHVVIDQSAITGESLPIEPERGGSLYASSLVKFGEAFAQITATGKSTFFGKVAEIMQSTTTPSHLETTIFSIVQHLVSFDVVLIALVSSYALYQGIPLIDMLPFSLLLLVASVPVALPATYALSTALGSIELAKAGVLVTHLSSIALGSIELAKAGVLVTHLSSIEEAAAMDVLCVDKTGTITKNALTVSHLCSYAPYTDDALLTLASMACEEATQDALDLAIVSAAKERRSDFAIAVRLQFIPFDPARKCSEAIIRYNGQKVHVLKGAPSELIQQVHDHHDIRADLQRLAEDGSRILAIILGTNHSFSLVGLIALHDMPRETSKGAIHAIHDLGIKVMMITGDGEETARAVAREVGIGSRAISRDELSHVSGEALATIDVISGVFPEDKFRVINLLQQGGDVCGMTGDGVNDAPALKKAEVGIAMSNATDVAKAAASLVLTRPGLVDVVEAVKTSRRIFQRMLTYTLNKIIKTLEISLLLGLGVIFTNKFVISQILIVLLYFTNDFVTMSISTDTVPFSPKPDHWNIHKLMGVGGILALCILGASFFILLFGGTVLHLPIGQVQTLVFLTLVFTGQATVYLVRERGHCWHSVPSGWMMLFSVLDIVAVIFMAINGVLMAPLSPTLVGGLLGAVVVYYLLIDFLKIKIFKLIHV
jgi:H+-transporting ATPase